MRGKLWNFTRPAGPKKVMRFENTGVTFSAMFQAQHWLHEHGYSYGSSDWSHYIPAMKGERYTLPRKLYNFDREDYDRVSAVMYSLDYRDGWVEVWLVEQGMRVLDLVLKHQWYDMIESGEKREEYREIKPYWSKRFVGFDAPLLSHRYGYQHANVKGYTHVRFRYGYTKRTMLYKIDAIIIGRGNPNWGAPTDRDVFIISLGERYQSKKTYD